MTTTDSDKADRSTSTHSASVGGAVRPTWLRRFANRSQDRAAGHGGESSDHASAAPSFGMSHLQRLLDDVWWTFCVIVFYFAVWLGMIAIIILLRLLIGV